MTWLESEPTSVDALYVMALCLALFLLSLAATRAHSGGGKRVRERRSNVSIAGVAVQMAGFMVVGFGPILPTLAPDSPAAIGEAAVVFALMGLAIGLFTMSARAMGRNWSILARTREDHQLVTWGPFAVIRHPIYTALFACLLAMALAFGHWRGLIVGVPLYWIGTWMRVAEEERLLHAHFGAAYDAYAARVKRFLPGLV